MPVDDPDGTADGADAPAADDLAEDDPVEDDPVEDDPVEDDQPEGAEDVAEPDGAALPDAPPDVVVTGLGTVDVVGEVLDVVGAGEAVSLGRDVVFRGDVEGGVVPAGATNW